MSSISMLLFVKTPIFDKTEVMLISKHVVNASHCISGKDRNYRVNGNPKGERKLCFISSTVIYCLFINLKVFSDI